MRRNLLVALASVLILAAMAWGQGDPRPTTQTVPIMTIDSSGRLVVVGDFANHALRVNVVAGSGSGVSGTIGAAFGTTVAPAGARDAGGFMASLTVTNAGRLNVTCDNCSSSAATFAAAFPSSGGAIGFKDGGGMMASATVDNAGNIFVIASQSSSAWTVTATGTITAHQGDTWVVTCTNCTGSTTSNFGSPFPAAGFANFKDGAGRMASATVDNASNLFVIASQGAANATPWTVTGTVTATGTVSAHQADTWTVQQGNAPWSATGTISAHQADAWTVSSTQGTSPWVVSGTVTATGTVTAHQGDTWTVGLSAGTTVNAVQSGTFTVTPVNTFASNFPSVGVAAGFRDGAGRMASASVDNAFNLFVIASQGQANAGQAWTVNMSQVNGTTIVTGGTAGLIGVGGPTATGSQASGNPVRVGGVTRSTAIQLSDGQMADLELTTSGDLLVRSDTSAATATIAPARVQMLGGTGQSANPSRIIACDNFASVTLSSNTTTLIVTGSATQVVYICSMNFVVSSATAINLVEGVGSFCNTNVQGIFGGTATATGWNLASNGGLTQGTGIGMIGKTANTGNNICLQNSTAATIAGGITWTKF